MGDVNTQIVSSNAMTGKGINRLPLEFFVQQIAWMPIDLAQEKNEKNEKNVAPSTTIPSATPHHHPLPVEGRPQPTCLRSVARTARKPPRPARKAPLTAMPAAPAVYCSAARASQLRLRVAPGSGQPAAPSALRGGRTLRLRRLSLAALRIHSLRSGHGLTGV